MPICQLVLVGPKPKPAGYPKELSTLGQHIKARRLDLGMAQSQLAHLLGASKSMVVHWEKQHNQPSIRFLPKIIDFLGCAPYETPTSFGNWLRQVRSCMGLSQEVLAAKANLDESTVAEWERGDRQPTTRYLTRLRDLLIVQTK